MKTDKELLELAAKAAGIDLTGYNWFDTPFYTGFERRNLCEGGFDLPVSSWNPLTEDGDALRLAVKLEMDVTHYQNSVEVKAWIAGEYYDFISEEVSYCRISATRRAIVRAAAAIGEKL